MTTIWARRLPGWIGALALVAVGIILLRADTNWHGLGLDTSGWVARSAELMSAVAALIGAVNASRWSVGSAAWLVNSVHPPWRAVLPPWAATFAAVLTGTAAVALYAFFVTLRAGHGDPSPDARYLGYALLSTVTWCLAGFVVGLLLPQWWIPGPVLLVALVSQIFHPPLITSFGELDIRNATFLEGLLALALLVGACWCTIPGSWRSTTGRKGASVGLLVVAIATMSVGTGPRQEPRDPATAVCSTTDRTELCLWPGHESMEAPIRDGIRTVSAQLPQGMHLPTRFAETGIKTGSPDFSHIKLPVLWFAYADIASATMRKNFTFDCLDTLDKKAREDVMIANFEVMTWMTMSMNRGPRPADVRGGPEGVDLDAVWSVAHGSDDAQRSWANERVSTIRRATCP